MNPRPSRCPAAARTGLVLFLATAAALPGCADSNGEDAVPAARADSTPSPAADTPAESVPESSAAPIVDQPLAPYRVELLELAFQAVSKFPKDPFLKDRSRGQEAVVKACFELEQPERALAYTEGIDNWRRGVGYADYAFYCAARGNLTDVDRHLDLALDQAETIRLDENPQAWRYDRVRSGVARTLAYLGRHAEAADIENTVIDAEAGQTTLVRVQKAADEDFDAFLEHLTAQAQAGIFDRIQVTLEAAAELYNRFYDDPERRGRAADLIRTAWADRLPLTLRIDALMRLAGFAIEQEDPGEALALLEETEQFINQIRWLPENHVPVLARLAALRHRAGSVEARAGIDGALALYNANREKIVDIDRAEALLPVAEAYVAAGDRAAALEVYRRVADESVVNPNSRPRAEDLSATCRSLALHAVEPDAVLKAQLVERIEALDHPW